MNFTNTNDAREDIYWDLNGQLWHQFNYQVWNQVLDQVNVQVPHQVFEQFKSIRNKITQEINK